MFRFLKMNFMIKRFNYYLAALISVLLLQTCSENSTNMPLPQTERGELVSYELKETYSTEAVKLIIDYLDPVDDIKAEYEVEHIKIIYKTLGPGGEIVQASGALFLPKSDENLPSACLMHGTETKRSNVASENLYSSLGGLSGLILASMGYAVIVPDYLGLGVSQTYHPYIIAEPTAECAVDMLRAVKFYDERIDYKNNQFFIAGYSEGGYAAYALHKTLQEKYPDEFTVTASAPMAGPYNVELTMEMIFNHGFPGRTIYLAYILYSYNEYYGWGRLEEIFKSPYHTTVPEMFDGTHSFSEVGSMLPDDYIDLFKLEFVTKVKEQLDVQLLAAVRENSLVDWVPDAPVKFYHGSADNDVPVENTEDVYNYLTELGKQDAYIRIWEGLSHSGAAQTSMEDAILFFEDFR